MPHITKSRNAAGTREPWSIPELNRILAAAHAGAWLGNAPAGPSARSGSRTPLPAALWMPAFLLTILDTGEAPRRLLEQVSLDDYQREFGKLVVAKPRGPDRSMRPPSVYRLHALTLEALELLRRAIPADETRLFPWDRTYDILLREYRAVLYRAQLPMIRGNLFGRLLRTARSYGRKSLLDRLDPTGAEGILRLGRPRFPRVLRNREDEYEQRKSVQVKTTERRKCELPLVLIHDPRTDRTLREFFRQRFAPVRLARSAPGTAADYVRTIDRLCEYRGCEVSLEQLSDDLAERFLAWLSGSGSVATANRYRRYLLSLWRYAWTKRAVADAPRSVAKFREPKRVVQSWSMDEMSRLLESATVHPGIHCGIPAGRFWPALILTLYDTGLRIDALMRLRFDALDLESGWLAVPAEVQKQNAEQVFRLHPETIAAVAEMHSPENRQPFSSFADDAPGREGPRKLFPWPFDPKIYQTLRRHYRSILRRAGLPDSAKDLFQKIRRTSATFIADATGDETAAQRHLGHSSVRVTIQNYLDPRKLTRRTVASDVLPRPNSNSGQRSSDGRCRPNTPEE